MIFHIFRQVDVTQLPLREAEKHRVSSGRLMKENHHENCPVFKGLQLSCPSEAVCVLERYENVYALVREKP